MMVHHVGVVESLVAEIRGSVGGELTSRNKVVDDLLDLRLAARADQEVVSVIDELLADLPGRSTVPNVWWLDALASVERALRSPTGATMPGAPIPPAASSANPSSRGPSAGPPPLPRRRPR